MNSSKSFFYLDSLSILLHDKHNPWRFKIFAARLKIALATYEMTLQLKFLMSFHMMRKRKIILNMQTKNVYKFCFNYKDVATI